MSNNEHAALRERMKSWGFTHQDVETGGRRVTVSSVDGEKPDLDVLNVLGDELALYSHLKSIDLERVVRDLIYAISLFELRVHGEYTWPFEFSETWLAEEKSRAEQDFRKELAGD